MTCMDCRWWNRIEWCGSERTEYGTCLGGPPTPDAEPWRGGYYGTDIGIARWPVTLDREGPCKAFEKREES